ACSSLDLEVPLSATPAWWQLLKGLYEVGVDLVVTTYHGRAPSTPWWRAYPNPARLEGDLVVAARRVAGRVNGFGRRTGHGDASGETLRQRAERVLARALVGPKWIRHLSRVIEREQPVDAVLFISVPPNHLRGVAAGIRS